MHDDRSYASAAATTVAIAWQWGRLDALAPSDLYAAMELRQQAFVVEQRCVFQDADGLDIPAWHLLGWMPHGADRALAAYLRVVDPGAKYREPSLGRIVTSRSVRGTGLGRRLVAEGIARTVASYAGMPIRIGAQRYLERFYATFGFRTVSAPYDEDGIVHVEMLRDADAVSR